MRLHRFISTNMEAILKEWEDFARAIQPTSGDLDVVDLRDHAQKMLEVIVRDMTTEQSEAERVEKSHGNSPETSRGTAAEDHATERLGSGFSISLLVAEYRALRASVLRLWYKSGASRAQMGEAALDDITRFNEAIDQALAESVARYSETVVENSDIFLGMLGHDLRSPLQLLSFGAAKMKEMEDADGSRSQLGVVMIAGVHRMTEMLNNLMDFTESRLGTGLTVNVARADLAVISHQLVEEFRAVHQHHSFRHVVSGNCTGNWDALRVAQICQNLISNALQHGSPKGEIVVTCKANEEKVTLSVKNAGKPIPPSHQKQIFEISNRQHHKQGNPNRNLGLGLYIVRELVAAHDGTISVESTESAGTVFSVELPKGAASATCVT